MSGINLLPLTVVQKLSEAGIPQDSVIFYRNDQWVYQVGQSIPNTDHLYCQSLDSLGPFDICPVDISFILSLTASQYTINRIGHQRLKDHEQVTGAHAPIAQITLEGFARSTANIPADATHFCWLYPPRNIPNINGVESANSDEWNLLKIGGFAYFNADNNNDDAFRLLRVNSLIVSADNGLTFDGPYPWRKEFTDQLWSQNRFHPVTLPSLREKGAQYFAFINPYEAFLRSGIAQEPWIPSPHGAFVYLFNENHLSHSSDCYFSVANDCLGVAATD